MSIDAADTSRSRSIGTARCRCDCEDRLHACSTRKSRAAHPMREVAAMGRSIDACMRATSIRARGMDADAYDADIGS